MSWGYKLHLLSVIIPTHNRAKYAIPTIKSLCDINGDIEIIVCDTSDNDDIGVFLSGYDFREKVKYIKINRILSVVDNFNCALDASTGEYIIFIGDDDFVSRRVIDAVSWAKKNAVDSIRLTFPVWYYWPDYNHASRGDQYCATLHIQNFSGEISRHDPVKALSDALENLGGGVFDMPRAYSGVVSRRLVDKILKKYGRLFGGVSPDIYSAALISFESESCFTVDYPIMIPGAGAASTAGQSASGGHKGGLRDNNHIAPFGNFKWNPFVPEFYSVETVWSYSLVEAFHVIKNKNIGVKLNPNFVRLILKCAIYHRDESRRVRDSFRHVLSSVGFLKFFGDFVWALLKEFSWGFGRIFNRFKKIYIKNNLIVERNVFDTRDAEIGLEAYLDAKGGKNIFLNDEIDDLKSKLVN
jgi:glycosyltransferase involved in cell wall biosynthesis